MLYTENQTYDGFKDHCIRTQLKFVMWPKKCHFTGKTVWLEHAYKQTAMWNGPGTPVYEYRWYDKDEFLIQRLKGSL